MRTFLIAAVVAALAQAGVVLGDDGRLTSGVPLPAGYNIVWDSPSNSSADSMPLSGHNMGLNVWVEGGDLLILIGSPNCMDENGMQVKLGLVRLRPDQSVLAKSFRQELRLEQGEVVVSGQTEEGKSFSVTLWCEATTPAFHAQIACDAPVGLAVSYETWSGYSAKVSGGGVQWVRRLPEVNLRRLRNMESQGVAEFAAAVPDLLSKLTTGGRLDGEGLIPAESVPGTFNGMNTKVCTLKTTAPIRQLELTVALRMEQDGSIDEWERGLAETASGVRQNLSESRAKAQGRWREFWNRSHIVIRPGEKPMDPAWQAGRNYQLIRYMLAANPSGRGMTLFNGGNFACSGNPDKRNWDGCQYMAQNQRLVYWPMLKSGDFDMLKVACDFYLERTELRRLHARKFWGVEGVTYPEPFSIFGLDAIGTTKDGRSSPKHLNYHYTSGMEFALMLLHYGSFSGRHLADCAKPALGILAYYDHFYQKALAAKTGKPLDANGKLVIYPSDALEIYHGCTNNTDVLAGLTALSRDLLELPSDSLSSADRNYCAEFQKRLPPFPIKEIGGRKYYGGAESWEWVFHNGNMEFPQMYVCFPFTILSLGRSDMSVAKNTWDLGAAGNPAVQKQNQCWYQSAINMARMGETETAERLTLEKLLHPGARFPTFYRTHYAGGRGEFCHTPDTDHGGCSMIALQEMLMQTDGRRILLGAAWPAGWNCDFKLNAAYQTVVEGRVVDGVVVVDRVTPESRRQDITVFPLKSPPPGPVSENRPATASTIYSAAYGAGKAFDGDLSTRWSMSAGQASGWLEVDLGKPTEICRAVIQERSYPQTTQFAVEAQNDDGTWRTLAEGDAIGADREVMFPPCRGQKFRLHIKGAKLINAIAGVTVDEFQLFGK